MNGNEYIIHGFETLAHKYSLPWFNRKSSSQAHRFSLSVNLQKLTSDLAGVEQQKKVLEMELQQWRKITFPQQTSAAPLNADCSCQGRIMPTAANPASQALEAEVKQLQARLKVSISKFQLGQLVLVAL